MSDWCGSWQSAQARPSGMQADAATVSRAAWHEPQSSACSSRRCAAP